MLGAIFKTDAAGELPVLVTQTCNLGLWRTVARSPVRCGGPYLWSVVCVFVVSCRSTRLGRLRGFRACARIRQVTCSRHKASMSGCEVVSWVGISKLMGGPGGGGRTGTELDAT